MQSWVNEPPRNPRRSKSSAIVEARGKGSSKSSEGRAKYARQSQDGLALLSHATQVSLALGLDNSRAVRALKGQVVPTMIVPRHKALEEAAAVEVDMDMPWDAECKAYGRLALYLRAEPKVPEQFRTLLADHAQKIKASTELHGLVLHCRVSPTFKDHNLYLVELAVTSELRTFHLAIFQALVALGGSIKYQGPPPKQPERDAVSALRALQHHHF
eukprot:TRINITY_DN59143_c0_g1_i1.p1 TRINITY_DN59143_c0_g1~~TRINITY_DN59143_c0_g1_i1.p1  ORF type:complete len:215 (-),score=30.28 TRINITY_DN59143_c0_g1_i1:207-851(-)